MKKLLDTIFNMTEHICKVMLIAQVVTISIVVVGRYIFNKTPAWGDPLALFLLTWVGLLSAAITLREDAHIRVTAIEIFLPPKVVMILNVLSNIALLFFSVAFLMAGYRLTVQTSGAIIPGLSISKGWLYGSTVVASILFIIAILENLLKSLKILRTGKE